MATRIRTRQTLIFAIVALIAVALLSACGGGGGAADQTPSPPSTDLHVSAKGLKFDKKTLVAVANSEVALTLDNKDGAAHNVSVYRDKSAKDAIFKGDVLSERKVQSWTFKTPEPGSYYFRCDVHPDMKGAFLVQ